MGAGLAHERTEGHDLKAAGGSGRHRPFDRLFFLGLVRDDMAQNEHHVLAGIALNPANVPKARHGVVDNVVAQLDTPEHPEMRQSKAARPAPAGETVTSVVSPPPFFHGMRR